MDVTDIAERFIEMCATSKDFNNALMVLDDADVINVDCVTRYIKYKIIYQGSHLCITLKNNCSIDIIRNRGVYEGRVDAILCPAECEWRYSEMLRTDCQNSGIRFHRYSYSDPPYVLRYIEKPPMFEDVDYGNEVII